MASSYFKSAPLGIINSNLISTVVSVGLHGLALFLLLPYATNLPKSEPEVSESGPINVPLIELNPNEQNRLPDQNAGLSTMPEFPNSSLGDLPMLDSPSLGSSLPNNFNNLPAPPALPPLPPLNSQNNYNRIPIALPPRRSFTPPPAPISRIPSPPPSLQTPTPKTPSVPNIENTETLDPRQNIDFGDPTPPKPNNPVFGQNRPNTQDPVATNPRLPVQPNNPPISRNSNNTTNREEQIIRNLVQDTLRGAENLTYNSQGTTRQEARRRDLEWMQQTGVTLKNQTMDIKGTYPKAACNLKLEGTAIYNVAVNGNGQLIKPPFLTQSSGYGLLNNQGLQQVRSLSFTQPTRVRVSFQYDPKICGTGVVERERNPQPQPQPTTSPTENKTPQPQPQPTTSPTENKTPQPQPQPTTSPAENKTPQPQPQPTSSPTENKTPQPKNQPNTPAESNPNANSPSTPKLDGAVAPPAGRK
ncbi:MAG: energy transducer TonB [Crocosphaera sp.]